MKKSLLVVLGTVLLLFFTGCASKVNIQSIQSSKVDSPSSKQLAILPFKNDTVAQQSSIASALSQHMIDNKPYFTIVERENLQKLLDEKRLNDSALVDIEDFSSIKGLTQAKTFLLGEVMHSTLKKRSFTQIVNNYQHCAQYNKENKCIRYSKIFRHCQTNTYSLLTHIKLVEVESGNILFDENYPEDKTMQACGTQRSHLPSKEQYNGLLAQHIAQRVLKDIAPSYYTFKVTLLEDIDIKLNDNDEQQFENALQLLQTNRVSKAQELLEELNRKTAARSYVILYNLGVTYEALNQLQTALNLYEKAESLTLQKEINQEISQAIIRVSNNLNERDRLKKLIK